MSCQVASVVKLIWRLCSQGRHIIEMTFLSIPICTFTKENLKLRGFRFYFEQNHKCSWMWCCGAPNRLHKVIRRPSHVCENVFRTTLYNEFVDTFCVYHVVNMFFIKNDFGVGCFMIHAYQLCTMVMGTYWQITVWFMHSWLMTNSQFDLVST